MTGTTRSADTKREKWPYADIVDLPRHVSVRRAPMTRLDRAAQFSPFAALTGFDAAIEETARLTDGCIELSDSAVAALNERLCLLAQRLDQEPEITVTYFEPDRLKSGGSYRSITGTARKLDRVHTRLYMTDGTIVEFEQMYSISGDIFAELERE